MNLGLISKDGSPRVAASLLQYWHLSLAKNVTINEPPVKTIETKTTAIQPLTQANEHNIVEKIALIVFNVEKELERVKILVPLSEIYKNPG